MKLKTVHVPRGYDGLHLEVDGAIVNIYVNLRDDHGHKVTTINVSPDEGRYAGEQGWYARDGENNVVHGTGARIVQETPEEYRARMDAARGGSR